MFGIGGISPITPQYIHPTTFSLFVIFQQSSKYNIDNSGLLTINDVQNSDEAFYTCSAGNLYGEISESAELFVSGKQSQDQVQNYNLQLPQFVVILIEIESHLNMKFESFLD